MPKASWILSLRRFFTLYLTPRSLALLAPLVILALSFSPTRNGALNAAQNLNPTWFVDAPILFRARAEPYDHYAVKDPTIVFSGGRYHMFYTGANASGGWQMLYSSATTLEGFRTAAHIFLSRIGEAYLPRRKSSISSPTVCGTSSIRTGRSVRPMPPRPISPTPIRGPARDRSASPETWAGIIT